MGDSDGEGGGGGRGRKSREQLVEEMRERKRLREEQKRRKARGGQGQAGGGDGGMSGDGGGDGDEGGASRSAHRRALDARRRERSRRRREAAAAEGEDGADESGQLSEGSEGGRQGGTGSGSDEEPVRNIHEESVERMRQFELSDDEEEGPDKESGRWLLGRRRMDNGMDGDGTILEEFAGDLALPAYISRIVAVADEDGFMGPSTAPTDEGGEGGAGETKTGESRRQLVTRRGRPLGDFVGDVDDNDGIPIGHVDEEEWAQRPRFDWQRELRSLPPAWEGDGIRAEQGFALQEYPPLTDLVEFLHPGAAPPSSASRSAAEVASWDPVSIRAPSGAGHQDSGLGAVKHYPQVTVFVGKLAIYEHEEFVEEERTVATIKLQHGRYRSVLQQHTIPYHAMRAARLAQILPTQIAACEEASAAEADLDDFDAMGDSAEDPDAMGLGATQGSRRSIGLGGTTRSAKAFIDPEQEAAIRRANLRRSLTASVEGFVAACMDAVSAANEVNDLAQAIHDMWKNVLDHRQRQGFTATAANVTVHRVKQQTLPLGGGDGDEGVVLPREPTLSNASALLAQAIEHVLPVLERAYAEISKIESTAASRSGALPDITVVSEFFRVLQNRVKKHPLVAAIVRLAMDGAYTPNEQCPEQEQQRRARVQQIPISIAINVNDRELARTPPERIAWPMWTVDFNRQYRLRVIHRPRSVSLTLLQPKWLYTSTIASVFVPVPSSDRAAGRGSSRSESMTTHGLRSFVDWFQFSRPVPITVTAPNGTQFNSHMSGAVLTGLAWDTGPSGDEISAKAETEARTRAAAARAAAAATAAASLATARPRDGTSPRPAGNRGGDDPQAGARAGIAGGARGGWSGAAGSTTERDPAMSAPRTAREGLSKAPVVPTPRELQGKGRMLGGRVRSVFDETSERAVPKFARERDFRRLLPDMDELDPNDPRNMELLRLQAAVASAYKADEDDDLRMGDLEELLACRYLADVDEYEDPRRHQLIRLRVTKPYLFSAPMPLSEAEIRSSNVYREMLADEETARRQQEEQRRARARQGAPSVTAATARMEGALEEGQDLEDARVTDKTKVLDFLQRVRESRATVQRASRRRHVSIGTVLQESKLPDIQLHKLLDITKLIPARKRALRPRPKQRHAETVQIENCRLLVQVISAKNVPVKLDNARELAAAAAAQEHGAMGAGGSPARRLFGEYDESERAAQTRMMEAEEENMLTHGAMNVSSFVEVRFQDHKERTASVTGRSPQWKETLGLPFHPTGNDFSPNNLSQIRDVVHVSLFDEVTEDDADRGGFYPDEETRRVEKRYLGSVSVPFATVYMEGKVEGVFRLNTPEINFGYQASLHRHNPPIPAHQGHGGAARRGPGGRHGSPGRRGGRGDAGRRRRGGEGGEDEEEGDAEGELSGEDDGAPSGTPGFNRQQTSEVDRERELNDTRMLMDAAGNATYVKLLLTFDPLLVPPAGPQDGTVSSADLQFAQYAEHWLHRVQRHNDTTRARQYKVFGTNVDGELVFLPRFLTPQAPPDNMDSLAKCVHFVSLIPFLEDWQAFAAGDFDMWCTSQQFLDLLAGDWEEHAILLRNFIAWLDSTGNSDARASKSYIVLGTAIPEGDSVYVMRVLGGRAGSSSDYVGTGDNAGPSGRGGLFGFGGGRNGGDGATGRHQGRDKVMFINATTGVAYASRDDRCPLQDISCIIGEDNVWANIQVVGRPAALNYDFNNRRAWMPFFTPEHPAPTDGLSTVQEEELIYPETPISFAYKVEKDILKTLKMTLRRWRSKKRATYFHKETSDALQDLLPLLERYKMGELLDLDDEHDRRLRHTRRSRNIHGFPLNFGYTDISAVEDAVRSTGIHDTNDADANFALAVRVFPYSNSVLSVWVYLAVVTPKV